MLVALDSNSQVRLSVQRSISGAILNRIKGLKIKHRAVIFPAIFGAARMTFRPVGFI